MNINWNSLGVALIGALCSVVLILVVLAPMFIIIIYNLHPLFVFGWLVLMMFMLITISIYGELEE